jgi:PncC family amidohydrolase
MNKPIEARVGDLLEAKGMKLAMAESCTGGLIAHRITNVPGSSRYFLGGVVCYADAVKRGLLGVSEDTLAQEGAVSRQTALEMARGIRKLMGAQIGISVTGIAGPSGGSVEKPVGLTWIAVIDPDTERVERYAWGGERIENKEYSAEAALKLLIEVIGERV